MIEFIRWFNLVASITIVVGLVVYMVLRWTTTTADVRLRSMAIAAYAFGVGVIGSVEGLVRDLPPGPRVYALTFATVLALITVVLPDRYRTVPYRRPPKGQSDGDTMPS